MSFVKLRDDRDGEKTAIASAMTPQAPQRTEAFLGQGCKITGTLTFTGPVELDGTIEGEVIAKESLTIGRSAVINAKISGAEVIVYGTVTGDIVASRRLSLRKPARISGNISCASLAVEEGVLFEGKCTMTGEAKAAPSKAA